jgi:hypothetical protein
MDQNNDTWAKRFREWGALLITAAIYGMFFYSLYKSATLKEPPPAFTQMLEVIKSLALLAAGYWLGSSAQGQRNQDATAVATAKAMDALAVSVPVAAVPSLSNVVPMVPVVSTASGPAVPVVQEPAPVRQEL